MEWGEKFRGLLECAGSYQSKCPASSMRWRSLRPPNVVPGETRQLCGILVAFTRPCLGRANSNVEDLRGLQKRRRVE